MFGGVRRLTFDLVSQITLHAKYVLYGVTTHGKPFTAAGFGNWFRDRCNEAELTHCSAHGVRKAAAARAAENERPPTN